MKTGPLITGMMLMFGIAIGVSGISQPANTNSEPNEFLGKWVFDRDFSFLQLTNSPSATWQKAPPGVPDWVAPTPIMVFGQLAHVTNVFSANEIIVYTKGMARTNSYEILKRPSPNEMVVKMADGSASKLRLVGGRMEIDVNLRFKLYFSRETK
jgi:hypothetical protein